MRCSNCGKCCEKTEMELSSNDIERLHQLGYQREEFTVADGYTVRLRNVDGLCYFYSCIDKKCRVYKKRPSGCRLYPIVYVLNEGHRIDLLCPMRETISKQELKTKGKVLDELLKTIDNERATIC